MELGGLLHWKCFGKTEDLQRHSSFLIFTRITGKSLYHLLRPTSTRLHDEIRRFCQPSLLLQIVEPRLSQKKCQLCAKEHARPVPFCLRKIPTVPFYGKFSPVFPYRWKAPDVCMTLCCIVFVFNLELLAPVENEEAPNLQDVQEMLKVEERAVVLALRDTFMPGLDGSDAIMFATLLADLFPNVQVPMIFENYGSQGNKMQMNEQVSNLEEIPVLSKAGEPGGDNVEGT